MSKQAVAKDRALKRRVDPYDSGMDVHQTEGHQRAVNLVSEAIGTANDLKLVVFDPGRSSGAGNRKATSTKRRKSVHAGISTSSGLQTGASLCSPNGAGKGPKAMGAWKVTKKRRKVGSKRIF